MADVEGAEGRPLSAWREKSFVGRYFTPENRLAEVICGIVMVLSFMAVTGGTLEEFDSRALLWAIVGCNVAWGVVDGVTYVLGNLLNRSLTTRLAVEVKRAPDSPEVLAEVDHRIDQTVGSFLTEGQKAELRGWLVEGARRHEVRPNRVTREDMYTAGACFVVVVSCVLPVVVPFLLIEDGRTALRVASGMMLLMLFGIGWRWAGYACLSRWKTGFALAGSGLVLWVVTVLLGG